MSSAFRYQADLPHQLMPVESVVEVFDGLAHRGTARGLGGHVDIVGNADIWDDLGDELLEENLRRVQSGHNRARPEAAMTVGRVERDEGAMLDGVSVDAHSCPHFSVEMETGTGKTYVYLRTMLALHQQYGFTKFIVVVPSVAILEGVKKSFADTRDHFNGVFGVTNFSALVYDGAKPGIVPAFARSTFPVVLIMTIQSFSRYSNNLYKSTDKVISELKPFEWIQQTRPIIVLDEPQNMGSDTSKAALRTLKPLFVLRYSATHKSNDRPNTVYRLTPVQAFRLGLVKQVQVVGITDLGLTSRPSLELREVLRDPIRAKVRARCANPDGQTALREITLKQGDLVVKHTKLPEHEGLKVANIRAEGAGLAASLELEGGASGGFSLGGGAVIEGSSEEVWAAQIEATIKEHFSRQRALRAQDIKVLTLFFIDRVANYQGEAPRIRELFDQTFDRLKLGEPDFAHLAAKEVREAYFAARKVKGKGKTEEEVVVDDVKEDSEEARRAYELIMKKKETLLTFPTETDPGTKVAFLFAHSALREGWDNPNVFQICTLNQTVSPMKKRQEIGRGLRLCVRRVGGSFERVVDPALNVLTVVANESYESYVRTLQTEYTEAGQDAPPKPTRPREAKAQRNDAHFKSEAFRSFWEKLCTRLDYTIDLDTEVLVAECLGRLNDGEATKFPTPKLALTRGRFVAVEYSIHYVQALADGFAQLRIHRASTEVEALHRGLVPPADQLLHVKVDDNLGKLAKNPHLMGFKVMELSRVGGEHRLVFTNEVELVEGGAATFSTTQIDAGLTEEVAVDAVEHPMPDIIGRTADETLLTRATVRRIFDGVSAAQKVNLPKHPEGWANAFVRVVREQTRDHIVERLRFRDPGGPYADLGPLDELFPPVTNPVQREIIDGGRASLYDKVQVDSDVERDFVNHRLMPDEQKLCIYFKFPPKFKITLPKVIGNYNPDWGILRKSDDGRLTLELVRETKGADDLEELRFLNEGRKLVLAQRYFSALGIDYRFVSPKVERYWDSRVQVARSPQLQVVRGRGRPVEGKAPVPVYNLKAAATAFSSGQDPELLGYVDLPARQARRQGLFVAQIMGRSMDKVAPDGAWCLWQHVRAPGASAATEGELLIVRRDDPADPALGGFTFKRWVRRSGRYQLEPVSTDPVFKPIMLEGVLPEDLDFIARFVDIVDVGEEDVRDALDG